MSPSEVTIRQILLRAEALYEQLGTPFVLSHPRRRRWAFVRALGATRLAAELGVSRITIVEARGKAFSRWRYWFFRYEQPLWQEITNLAPDQWERNFVQYLRTRARLRRGEIVQGADLLTALAVRSLGTIPWLLADPPHWQHVWRHLHRGKVNEARAIADLLGWSAVQWRRARCAVHLLRSLVWLPFSQRQLLALSTWPAPYLRALERTGQALFRSGAVSVTDLAGLCPRRIARLPADAIPERRTLKSPDGGQRSRLSTVPEAPVPEALVPEAPSWRQVCLLLRRGHVRKAQEQLATLGWSARHVRRLRLVTKRLTSLLCLPLSQRQLIALSCWPDAWLRDLRLKHRALVGQRVLTIAGLVRLSPSQLAALAAHQESPRK